MKQLSFSALLLLIVLIAGSCKKIPVYNGATNSNISFKIDGVAKSAKGDKSVFALYAKEYNLMQINGNLDATGDQGIGLGINNFHGVGEYTDEDFLAVYNTPEIEESILGVAGKIKVTEYTAGKSIQGEFQFTGEVAVIKIGTDEEVIETKVFSEGKFQVKVTDY
jgi:hypothetical protein